MTLRTPNRTAQTGIYKTGSPDYVDVSSGTAVASMVTFSAKATDDSWSDSDTVGVAITKDASNYKVWLASWDETNEYLELVTEEESVGTISDTDAVTVTATLTQGTVEQVLNSMDSNIISGLITARNGTTALDVAAGKATVTDGTNWYLAILPTLLTKTQAAWSVGHNNGGLDSGSTYSASTWYHVYLIKRSDTGVVDVLFSTSSSSPTLPTNYDLKRRIGAFLTDGSSLIVDYTQVGDYFSWRSVTSDFNQNTGLSNTAWATFTARVPPINNLLARGFCYCRQESTTAATCGFTHGNDSPSQSYYGALFLSASANYAGNVAISSVDMFTNSSGQLKYWASATSNLAIHYNTTGWVDPRGRE